MNTEKNRIDWVVMNMRLRGSSLSEGQVLEILHGEFVIAGDLEDHLAIDRLAALPSYGDLLLNMEEEISLATLEKFYKVLSGGEEAEYRKRTPVLFHLGYNPVLPQEIEGELQALFRHLPEREEDAVRQAVFLHNEIIRIYPFNDWNEEIARMAMEYQLLYRGEPYLPITMSEQEYNLDLSSYLHGRDSGELYRQMRAGLLMEENREDKI